MKKSLLIIFLITSIYARTQTFVTKINNEVLTYPSDLLIYNETTYFFSCIYYLSEQVSNSAIYKIDEDGNVVDSIHFMDAEKNYVIRNIELLNNGNLMAWGSIQTGGFLDYDFLQLELDPDLNIIEEYREPTNKGMIEFIEVTKNSLDHFIISGTFKIDSIYTQWADIFLKEMSQEGEIIQDTIFETGYWDLVFDIECNLYNDKIYSSTLNHFSKATNIEIVEYSSEFEIVNQENIYYLTDTYNTSTINFINSEEFIYAGNYRPGNNLKDNNHYLGVFKFNIDYDLLKEYTITSTDTMFYAGILNNLDFVDTSNIYFGSYRNYNYGNQWTSQPSYFQINNLNSNLELNWQKYYGGDAYYMLYNILATEDGGAILLGTYYQNGENGIHEKDIVIMKVDENGLITSTNEEESIPIKNAIITPNPGKDYIQLHTGIFPAALQMFDINGKLILEEEINQNSTTIHPQSLSSGTYIWQLLKDGQVVETDKWVKK